MIKRRLIVLNMMEMTSYLLRHYSGLAYCRFSDTLRVYVTVCAGSLSQEKFCKDVSTAVLLDLTFNSDFNIVYMLYMYSIKTGMVKFMVKYK